MKNVFKQLIKIFLFIFLEILHKIRFTKIKVFNSHLQENAFENIEDFKSQVVF